MPENLCLGMDQLALMQIKHKASYSELFDGFKRVLWQEDHAGCAHYLDHHTIGAQDILGHLLLYG